MCRQSSWLTRSPSPGSCRTPPASLQSCQDPDPHNLRPGFIFKKYYLHMCTYDFLFSFIHFQKNFSCGESLVEMPSGAFFHLPMLPLWILERVMHLFSLDHFSFHYSYIPENSGVSWHWFTFPYCFDHLVKLVWIIFILYVYSLYLPIHYKTIQTETTLLLTRLARPLPLSITNENIEVVYIDHAPY